MNYVNTTGAQVAWNSPLSRTLTTVFQGTGAPPMSQQFTPSYSASPGSQSFLASPLPPISSPRPAVLLPRFYVASLGDTQDSEEVPRKPSPPLGSPLRHFMSPQKEKDNENSNTDVFNASEVNRMNHFLRRMQEKEAGEVPPSPHATPSSPYTLPSPNRSPIGPQPTTTTPQLQPQQSPKIPPVSPVRQPQTTPPHSAQRSPQPTTPQTPSQSLPLPIIPKPRFILSPKRESVQEHEPSGPPILTKEGYTTEPPISELMHMSNESTLR